MDDNEEGKYLESIISNKLLRYIKVSQAIENERAKSRADLAQAVFDKDFISASLKVFRKSPKECKVLAIRHSKTTGHTCNTLFFCVLVIPFFIFFIFFFRPGDTKTEEPQTE